MELYGVAFLGVWFFRLAIFISAEDPYRFFDWKVTFGEILPLGVPQQACCRFMINSLSIFFLSNISLSVCLSSGDTDQRAIPWAGHLRGYKRQSNYQRAQRLI